MRQFLTALRTHLDENTINAHSHADFLSKLVTCLQTAWTGIQVIARLVDGLNVSLAEVVTCGYIITALLTYAFWYQKPYNIGMAQAVDLDMDFGPSIPRLSNEEDLDTPGGIFEQGNRSRSNMGSRRQSLLPSDYGDDSASEHGFHSDHEGRNERRVIMRQENVPKFKGQSESEDR